MKFIKYPIYILCLGFIKYPPISIHISITYNMVIFIYKHRRMWIWGGERGLWVWNNGNRAPEWTTFFPYLSLFTAPVSSSILTPTLQTPPENETVLSPTAFCLWSMDMSDSDSDSDSDGCRFGYFSRQCH